MTDKNADSLIRWEEVQKMVGISRTSVWRLEKDGEFPKRRHISKRAVGWSQHEIQKWLESRPQASN